MNCPTRSRAAYPPPRLLCRARVWGGDSPASGFSYNKKNILVFLIQKIQNNWLDSRFSCYKQNTHKFLIVLKKNRTKQQEHLSYYWEWHEKCRTSYRQSCHIIRKNSIRNARHLTRIGFTFHLRGSAGSLKTTGTFDLTLHSAWSGALRLLRCVSFKTRKHTRFGLLFMGCVLVVGWRASGGRISHTIHTIFIQFSYHSIAVNLFVLA